MRRLGSDLQDTGGQRILEFSGHAHAENTGQMRAALASALGGDAETLMVDARRVLTIDVAGAAALVQGYLRAEAAGVCFSMQIAPGSEVEHMLDLVGLTETLRAATASLEAAA